MFYNNFLLILPANHLIGMEKNKMITLGQGLCRFVQLFLILFAALFTFVLIHWHFSPDSYALVELPDIDQEGFTMQRFRIISVSDGEPDPGSILLSELFPVMLYWLYVRTLILLTLTYLIFRALRSVLSSIRSLETFRNDNISAFQQIGKYALWIFFLTSFNLWIVPGDSNVNLNLALGPLLIAVFAFIMAEVFKEGNQLMEDSKLTI